MKVDWLKAHALRELNNKENKTKLETLLTWHLVPRATIRERIIGEIRFALLLIPIDPVIVAMYYRENHFEGVSVRDWLMLVKATLVACIVWLLIVEPLVLGITPEDMARLFTEGGHGAESQLVNVDSTGFGLYIVKNIIEGHKGKVWAESEGEVEYRHSP